MSRRDALARASAVLHVKDCQNAAALFSAQSRVYAGEADRVHSTLAARYRVTACHLQDRARIAYEQARTAYDAVFGGVS